MATLKKSSRRYQRYAMGCKKYAHFFHRRCQPNEQIDSHCRIMRLAYFWPAFIGALRATLMVLAVGIPMGLFLTMPLEVGTGSVIIVVGVAVIFGVIYAITIAVDKWKEGRYERQRARRLKREAREKRGLPGSSSSSKKVIGNFAP